MIGWSYDHDTPHRTRPPKVTDHHRRHESTAGSPLSPRAGPPRGRPGRPSPGASASPSPLGLGSHVDRSPTEWSGRRGDRGSGGRRPADERPFSSHARPPEVAASHPQENPTAGTGPGGDPAAGPAEAIAAPLRRPLKAGGARPPSLMGRYSTNRADKSGLRSATRNNKATRLLTRPGRTS